MFESFFSRLAIQYKKKLLRKLKAAYTEWLLLIRTILENIENIILQEDCKGLKLFEFTNSLERIKQSFYIIF